MKKNEILGHIFCVTGTNGIEKSMVTLELAKLLQNEKSKILLVDFDAFHNCLSTTLGLKNYSKFISQKGKQRNIEDFIININSKIDLLSGIGLLLDGNYQTNCQKLQNIFLQLKKSYHSILVDMSSECFFDVTKVILQISHLNIFVAQANLQQIKKANNLLNIYQKEWKIPKEKFCVLWNQFENIYPTFMKN